MPRRKNYINRARRYYANTVKVEWPPEMQEFNRKFTKTLEHIKRRHDPTVTTVAQGVLEWKRSQNARNINLDVQHWLDRFYLSRIGIRFLIGQREHTRAIMLQYTGSSRPYRHCIEHPATASGLCRDHLHTSGAYLS